jgi:CHAD domain-containing protein
VNAGAPKPVATAETAETAEPPAPAPPPPHRRADDFLTPLLFIMVAAVRREALRVGPQGPGLAVDPEAIHDFRVALRRLRTALRPARRVYGERRLRAIGAELRRFAMITGALRDEEVLRETLVELELPATSRADLDAWLVRRARQERARRRRVGTLIASTMPSPTSGPPLGEALAHLERRLGRRRPEEHTAADLARSALADAEAGVAEHLHAPPSDGGAMHALRIRYKRLRYSADLFAPLLGEGAGALAKEAARMQKRLGELHDLDEALARIRRARGLPEATRTAVTRALTRARARQERRLRSDLGAERDRRRAGVSAAA